MGRQRNKSKYVVVGHISGESGSSSVGAMWSVTKVMLKRSWDKEGGATVKWLSGWSLCVCVLVCFVDRLSKAPLFTSKALLK